jgi:Protein phosphatase 2C
MRIEVVDSFSDAVHEPNEDAWGRVPDAAWLIDGASTVEETSAFSRVSNAAFLANFANEALRVQLACRAHVDESTLREALAVTARRFADRLPHDRPEASVLPSAAISLVGLAGGQLAVIGLGDVTAVVEQPGGVAVFHNPRALQRELQQLNDPSYTPKRAREQARHRRLTAMNKPGGYWILSTDPRAAIEARAASYAVTAGTHVLLASDGFARAIDVFDIEPTWQALISNVVSGGRLADIGEQVRKAERADADRSAYPRISMSDDATAVLLRVTT